MPGPSQEDKQKPGALRRGVYAGTFNPPTIGHLAIVEAALTQRALDRLDLVISRQPLGKGVVAHPPLEQRIEVVAASVAHLPGVDVVLTDLRLIADIASGYDVVVMGADKWDQVNDVAFYADAAERDAALARLPELAIAGRDGVAPPPSAVLDVPDHVNEVSASAARAGQTEWMTAAAIASGYWT